MGKITQEEYIEILAADLGWNRQQRNGYISSICQRKISYLDELLPFEKSKVIDQLKSWKENKKVIQPQEEED